MPPPFLVCISCPSVSSEICSLRPCWPAKGFSPWLLDQIQTVRLLKTANCVLRDSLSQYFDLDLTSSPGQKFLLPPKLLPQPLFYFTKCCFFSFPPMMASPSISSIFTDEDLNVFDGGASQCLLGVLWLKNNVDLSELSFWFNASS